MLSALVTKDVAPITPDGVGLESVDSFKNLGVCITNIDQGANDMNSRIGMFSLVYKISPLE